MGGNEEAEWTEREVCERAAEKRRVLTKESGRWKMMLGVMEA
jgi:hypothetical protein